MEGLTTGPLRVPSLLTWKTDRLLVPSSETTNNLPLGLNTTQDGPAVALLRGKEPINVRLPPLPILKPATLEALLTSPSLVTNKRSRCWAKLLGATPPDGSTSTSLSPPLCETRKLLMELLPLLTAKRYLALRERMTDPCDCSGSTIASPEPSPPVEKELMKLSLPLNPLRRATISLLSALLVMLYTKPLLRFL